MSHLRGSGDKVLNECVVRELKLIAWAGKCTKKQVVHYSDRKEKPNGQSRNKSNKNKNNTCNNSNHNKNTTMANVTSRNFTSQLTGSRYLAIMCDLPWAL